MSKFKEYNFVITRELFSKKVYWSGRKWEDSIEKAQRYSVRKRAQTIADDLKLVMFNLTKRITVEEILPKCHAE